MYSVNVDVISGYEIKITKGNPSIKAHVGFKGTGSVITMFSEETFELHLIKNGEVRGILTPGKL